MFEKRYNTEKKKKQGRSKPRARSTEKRAKQFQRIIDKGRELFITRGAGKFKMRDVADMLDMYQGNLYNYVNSKRELFFAIIKNDHERFREDMKTIVENHEGTFTDLLIKLSENYISLAETNPNMLKMMFSTPAPYSKRIGPIEKSFKPQSLNVIEDVIQKAIDNDEIWEVDVSLFAHYLWGLVQGGVTVARNYAEETPDDKDALKRFHEFLLMQLNHLINTTYKKIS